MRTTRFALMGLVLAASTALASESRGSPPADSVVTASVEKAPTMVSAFTIRNTTVAVPTISLRVTQPARAATLVEQFQAAVLRPSQALTVRKNAFAPPNTKLGDWCSCSTVEGPWPCYHSSSCRQHEVEGVTYNGIGDSG
jgi:hypothetical protein